jgi:hypothetical protein
MTATLSLFPDLPAPLPPWTFAPVVRERGSCPRRGVERASGIPRAVISKVGVRYPVPRSQTSARNDRVDTTCGMPDSP